MKESSNNYKPTDYQENFVAELMETHLVGDFCIIGPSGCGKSATVTRFASLLGYTIEPIVLYQVKIISFLVSSIFGFLS